MDPTRTRPHTVEFVKTEIRTGLFFSLIGSDRAFQNPQHCECPTVKAHQIYQAMQECLPRLRNVSTDDEQWIRVHLEKLRQNIEPPLAAKLRPRSPTPMAFPQ
jgi:hypothetical protein